jgi:methylmalonyl-CoA mutase cobalamin-binding subunit
MEKAIRRRTGKVLLATVKGDVHDIGKNLVEIILSNNGYDVMNLGIKVPPEELIKALHEHKPDAIGLSGLLVKSAQQMVVTGSDLRDQGLTIPLLVGGAALSREVHVTKIAPAYQSPTFYAKDAMTGLRLMNEIMDPATRRILRGTCSAVKQAAPAAVEARCGASEARSSKVRVAIADSAGASVFGPARAYACRIWPRSGATSIRSCCTAGTWASRGTSRSCWPSATRRRWRTVPPDGRGEAGSGGVHEGAGGMAVLRGGAGRQFGFICSKPRAKRAGPYISLRPAARADGLCLSDYILPDENGRRDHSLCFV